MIQRLGSTGSVAHSVLRVSCIASSLFIVAGAFSSMTGNMDTGKRIYGIPHSGWRSPSWNWGSAVGTGHDCAKICRQQYGTRDARRALVDNLLTAPDTPPDFEEVKLVLALSWQRNRWKNRDGGPNRYNEVLELMAQGERYEVGDSPTECALRLVEDMQTRYATLQPSSDQLTAMENLMTDCESNVDRAQRRCSGLVLEAMGFVEQGC